MSGCTIPPGVGGVFAYLDSLHCIVTQVAMVMSMWVGRERREGLGSHLVENS